MFARLRCSKTLTDHSFTHQGYFEHSTFSGIEIVELKLPSSCADLTAKINQEALGYEDKNKNEKTWQQVVLLQVFMLWDLPTGEKGFTVVDKGNYGSY